MTVIGGGDRRRGWITVDELGLVGGGEGWIGSNQIKSNQIDYGKWMATWCDVILFDDGVMLSLHHTPLHSIPSPRQVSSWCILYCRLSLSYLCLSLSFDPAPGCGTPLKMWILLLLPLSHCHHHFLIPFIGGYDHRLSWQQ